MMAPLPEPAMTKQLNGYTGKVMDVAHYTKAQMLSYGRAEFERAVVLAMQATRPFGSVGDVIAVSIAHIERSEG